MGNATIFKIPNKAPQKLPTFFYCRQELWYFFYTMKLWEVEEHGVKFNMISILDLWGFQEFCKGLICKVLRSLVIHFFLTNWTHVIAESFGSCFGFGTLRKGVVLFVFSSMFRVWSYWIWYRFISYMLLQWNCDARNCKGCNRDFRLVIL